MRIGVFDSGLGGLLILRALVHAMPEHAYRYLGDTKRVPYGDRSPETIRTFTHEGVAALVQQGCSVILLACNTASVHALAFLQARYADSHPHVRILGMIEPSLQAIPSFRQTKIGILATQATVDSGFFVEALRHRGYTSIKQQAAPLLVPAIEQNMLRYSQPILYHYLQPFAGKIDILLLACTHYPRVKTRIRAHLGPKIRVLSQDEFIVPYLREQLRNFEAPTDSKQEPPVIQVTDITPLYRRLTKQWFGTNVTLKRITLAPMCTPLPQNPKNASTDSPA